MDFLTLAIHYGYRYSPSDRYCDLLQRSVLPYGRWHVVPVGTKRTRDMWHIDGNTMCLERDVRFFTGDPVECGAPLTLEPCLVSNPNSCPSCTRTSPQV